MYLDVALAIYFPLELMHQHEKNYLARGCKDCMAVGLAQNIQGFVSVLRCWRDITLSSFALLGLRSTFLLTT